ncbi:ATP-binding protein [Shewanella algae]|uniref:ATP-binding protein n=1 Tax=Shewanella algae TaxID=38313 RepID=UPI001AAFA177|nr:ATP-binding protein [Shewanella algae]MBO2634960.1 ATP-binding protein [Shewanella algae]
MKADIIDLLNKKPGLKGREIAKLLGLDKKDVNSLLYNDATDDFQQKDLLWFIRPKSVVVRVEKTGWLSALDFDDILSRSPDLWLDSTPEIRFEFHNCSIMLGAIARILSLVNQLACVGKKIILDFSECSESFSYLCRVGLFDALNQAVQVFPKVQDHSTHYGKNIKLMEFVSIPAGTEESNLPKRLKDAFVELAGDQYANTAFGFIAEYINNIIEHSQTPIPGVAALQVYGKGAKRKKVQTIFSDSGRGIIGTIRPVLKSRYPLLHKKYPLKGKDSDVNLLKEVLEFGGVSGAQDADFKGRGLGLKVSARNAAKFDATICVRQETFELTLKYRQGALHDCTSRTKLQKILGTHICFDFYLD